MTLDPFPGDLMLVGDLIQPLPQDLIFDRLFANTAHVMNPAVTLPAMDPFRDPVHQILGVGSNRYPAGFPQSRQSLNDRTKLHSIIGGV